MTVEEITGAVSHPTMGWNEIDWYKAQKEVRRLQARSAIRSLETIL
jgi:hypothetical protein